MVCYLEIWTPPEKVEDVRKNKALMHSLRSRHIKMLAETAIELIESEQSFNKLLNRLADVVYNDDPLLNEPALLESSSSKVEDVQEVKLFDLEEGLSKNGMIALKCVRELVEVSTSHVAKQGLPGQVRAWGLLLMSTHHRKTLAVATSIYSNLEIYATN